MRFGVSNLIFGQLPQTTQNSLLKHSQVCDFAPTVHYGSWANTPKRLPQKPYVGAKTQICALQSLYFGVQGASLVRSDLEFELLFEHHTRLVNLASASEVEYLVFGSPGTRSGRISSVTEAHMHLRVKRLADLAAAKGIKLCFEVNSSKFGCEFLSCNASLLTLLNELKHPGLGLHLDVGQVQEEGLDPIDFVEAYSKTLDHLHLSAPDFTCKPEMTPLFLEIIKLLRDTPTDVVLEVQTLGSASEDQLIAMCETLADAC